MDKKKLFLFTLFFYFSNAFCQQTLGIMDLSAKSGISENDSSIFTDIIFDSLFKLVGSKYNIIARGMREILLEEHKFALSGLCDDFVCAIEIGKYLAADLMIVGSFYILGPKYYISLQLVDVNSTKVEGSTIISGNGYDEIIQYLGTGIQDLFGISNTDNPNTDSSINTKSYIVTGIPDNKDSSGSKHTIQVKDLFLNFRFIEPKTFYTGIDDSGIGSVSRPYLIAETETTYRLWYSVRIWAEEHGYKLAFSGREGHNGTDGAKPKKVENHPVTFINWRDAMVWCNALTEYVNFCEGSSYSCVYYCDENHITPIRKSSESSEITALEMGSQDAPFVKDDANGFRMCTSNEWELAARYILDINDDGDIMDKNEYYPGDFASGATADYNNDEETEKVAWYNTYGSNPVAIKKANALGIFDMSGNIYELCFDWEDYDPKLFRICRGGYWEYNRWSLRIGHSSSYYAWEAQYNLGFRIAKNPQ